MLGRLAARLRVGEEVMEQDQVPSLIIFFIIIMLLAIIIKIMIFISGKGASIMHNSINFITKLIFSRSSERLDQT